MNQSPPSPDPIPEMLKIWLYHHIHGPTSVLCAATAAAMRTLEDGYDMEQAKKASSVAAKAWLPEPGCCLRAVTIHDLDSLAEWKQIPYSSVSQRLATQAGVLRALELGQDMKSAVAAGRGAARAWKPRKSHRSSVGKLLRALQLVRAGIQILGRKLTFHRGC